LPVTCSFGSVPLYRMSPVYLDRFTLSPLGGLYYIVGLQRATGDGGSFREERAMPLGLVLGTDLGFMPGGVKGFGEFYASIRYLMDLGVSVIGDGGLQYTRGQLGLSVGYKFSFFKTKS
jgi:hypothetical protein